MTRTCFCAALLAALVATPVPAQPAKVKPVGTAQLQPGNRILATARTLITRFAGPDDANKVDEGITEKLGEKGLTGLDLARPATAYQLPTADPRQPTWVVLVPVSDQAEFLDLLSRVEIKSEPVADAQGVYQIEIPNVDKPAYFKVTDATAYVVINGEVADLDSKKLLKPADILTPNEGSLVVVTSLLENFPPEMAKKLVEASDDNVEQSLDAVPIPGAAKERMLDALRVVNKYSMLQYTEGRKVVVRLNVDPQTAIFTTDYDLEARPGTDLAGAFAARKPTDNQFAGVITPNAVGSLTTRFPLFLPELRDGTAGLLETAEELGVGFAPEEYQPVARELIRGFARTAKAGRLDLAAVVTGPTEKGLYTVTAGLSFDDPFAVEAELRKLVEGLEPEQRNLVKLDAYKAEGVVIHEVNTDIVAFTEYGKVFGNKTSACLAFTNTGVLVQFGHDSLAKAKAALAATAKPVRADVLDLKLNMQKARQLAVKSGSPNAEAMIPARVSDELRSVLKLSVAGGKSLKVQFLMDLGVIPTYEDRQTDD